MHVHFEDTTITRSDCTVHALSWMGKVPEVLPNEEGWKLNRIHYYQEGWLSTGNAKGIVGVTFTTCHCKKNFESPPRLNFNLRGHRNEVVLVKWNEPYQKLATCDINGVIFVWIKHEGRWSIELINDRNSQVTDFAWSHDGRMALICYRDGFVLVGSVAGQRFWSSMLNLDNTVITCGVWTPDDQKVIFGTTDGQVIVMSANGGMVAQTTIQEGVEIVSLSWSCEKFNMEENDFEGNSETRDEEKRMEDQDYILSVCFKPGTVYLMSSYDDPCPRVVHTNLTGIKLEWCSDGEVLAIGGFVRQPNLECNNYLHFYTKDGNLHYATSIPTTQGKPLTALTWGHNDKRLFLAVGCYILTAWVTKKVSSLQLLCRHQIHKCLKDDLGVQKLPLPTSMKSMVEAFFSPTIKGYIPDPFQLRKFISTSPPGNERLHCTMMRHGEENFAGYYTLYLEYLGGLIPILKGKRASKLKPEFIIFDPKLKLGGKGLVFKAYDEDAFPSSTSPSSDSDSDTDVAEGCGSPRMQRKPRRRRSRPADKSEQKTQMGVQRTVDEILYDDNLPESDILVEVTSNIWGTKFKIHGVAPFLPVDLGQVLYKTSLLHLQPRQMTVSITELSDDLRPESCDPSYNPNSFSESEDEINGISDAPEAQPCFPGNTPIEEGVVAISPITSDPIIRQASDDTRDVPGLFPVKIEIPDKLSPLPRSSPSEYSNIKLGDNASKEESSSLQQKRSPSFKGQSLSPAEQMPFSSNTLVDGTLDTQFMSREAYIGQGAIPKVCRHMATTSIIEDSARTAVAAAVVTNHNGKVHRSSSVNTDVKSDTCGWNGRSSQEIKYMDEEEDGHHSDRTTRTGQCYTVGSPGSCGTSKDVHSRTTSYSEANGIDMNGAVQSSGPKVIQKRLVLAQPKPPKHDAEPRQTVLPSSEWRKSQSLEMLPGVERLLSVDDTAASEEESANSAIMHAYNLMKKGEVELKMLLNDIEKTSADIESEISRSSASSKRTDGDKVQSASLPSSPVRKIAGQRKYKICSPLLNRKVKSHKAVDSSDEELVFSTEEITTSENYRNLETFQKAQLKQKVPGKSRKSSGQIVRFHGSNQPLCRSIVCVRSVRLFVQLKKARTKSDSDQPSSVQPDRHKLVMHNKAPIWNENSQVYQLDFGGRVTQESAKNFQIEFRGKQVMQFGRIDGNAYTLDFQYPFTAVQAFAVALANVTQRLK